MQVERRSKCPGTPPPAFTHVGIAEKAGLRSAYADFYPAGKPAGRGDAQRQHGHSKTGAGAGGPTHGYLHQRHRLVRSGLENRPVLQRRQTITIRCRGTRPMCPRGSNACWPHCMWHERCPFVKAADNVLETFFARFRKSAKMLRGSPHLCFQGRSKWSDWLNFPMACVRGR